MRAFSKSFVLGDRQRRLRVDANTIRIKKDAFLKNIRMRVDGALDKIRRPEHPLLSLFEITSILENPLELQYFCIYCWVVKWQECNIDMFSK